MPSVEATESVTPATAGEASMAVKTEETAAANKLGLNVCVRVAHYVQF